MEKCALITGATSGIGEALAKLLASKGYTLILSGRNESKLLQMQQEYSCEIIAADLKNRGERQKLVACIQEKAPELLINNAGFGAYGKAIDLPTDEMLELLEVNGNALLELTLEGVKALKKQGKMGTIMNISSVASFTPLPGFAVYAASKAFVTSLSEALDFELKGSSIRVLAACPGMVATDFRYRAAKGKTRQGNPSLLVMSPSFAAEEIFSQIERGKRLHTFHWPYRLFHLMIRFLLPKSLVARLISLETSNL